MSEDKVLESVANQAKKAAGIPVFDVEELEDETAMLAIASIHDNVMKALDLPGKEYKRLSDDADIVEAVSDSVREMVRALIKLNAEKPEPDDDEENVRRKTRGMAGLRS